VARGPTYKVPRRRRREGKTNYYRRYRMVKSGQKIRVVVRKTNTQIIAQVIEFAPNGDKTLVGVTSKSLRNYGWLGDLNNTPAAYLTGLVAGLLSLKKGITYAIPDIGMHKSVKGSRIYAVLKGFVDAGVKIPVDEEMFPDEDRILGKHISEYANLMYSNDQAAFESRFSEYLKRGLDPRNLPQHFNEVKDKILKVFSGGKP